MEVYLNNMLLKNVNWSRHILHWSEMAMLSALIKLTGQSPNLSATSGHEVTTVTRRLIFNHRPMLPCSAFKCIFIYERDVIKSHTVLIASVWKTSTPELKVKYPTFRGNCITIMSSGIEDYSNCSDGMDMIHVQRPRLT